MTKQCQTFYMQKVNQPNTRTQITQDEAKAIPNNSLVSVVRRKINGKPAVLIVTL